MTEALDKGERNLPNKTQQHSLGDLLSFYQGTTTIAPFFNHMKCLDGSLFDSLFSTEKCSSNLL